MKFTDRKEMMRMTDEKNNSLISRLIKWLDDLLFYDDEDEDEEEYDEDDDTEDDGE